MELSLQKMKARVFFVDNNAEEINKLWSESRLSGNSHTLIPFEPFTSINHTLASIEKNTANVIVLGHYLDGVTTGSDVVWALKNMKYPAVIISNTGGDSTKLFPGVKYHADRRPWMLWNVFEGVRHDDLFEMLVFKSNADNFSKCLESGDFKQAEKLLYRIKNYGRLEPYIDKVLTSEVVKNAPEFVITALKYFLSQREDMCPYHGYWVHSTSHFYKKLWELGLRNAAIEFLRVAIQGANELSDINCISRLICDFFRYSKYNDDPKDFGITVADIGSLHSLGEYERARIQVGVLKNEAEQLIMQLSFADNALLTGWSNEYQLTILEKVKIDAMYNQLDATGYTPIPTLAWFVRDLHQKQYDKFKKEMEQETEDMIIKRYEKALTMTKEFL